MKLEFSTTQKNYVEQYLEHADFNWMNEAQKCYVKENIGDIRVQDPTMYHPARLTVHNNGEKHAQEIQRLGTVPRITIKS